MKITSRIIALAGACTLLAATAPAGAGTLSGGFSTPNPSTITSPGQVINIKHTFGVAYYNNEKFACGARFEFADGSPPENVAIKAPMGTLARDKSYNKPGLHTVTLSGFAHSGLVACLGSTSTTALIEDGIKPAGGKPGAGGAGSAAVTPAGLGAQGMFPAASKPRLMGMTLAKTEFSPGMVELTLDVKADRPSESCQFTLNVMSNNGGADTINLQLYGPMTYHFAVPAPSQKVPLTTMSVGKYRLNVAAVTLANPACVGAVSADFEVKRQVLHITPDITGVSVKDSDYDKVNKTWMVSLAGMNTANCTASIDFKHVPSGKVSSFNMLSTLPVRYGVTFAEEPTYGEYEVTVHPRTDPATNLLACMGVQKTTVRHAAPAIAPLNMMKIDTSALVANTLLSEVWYGKDGTLSLAVPKSLIMKVIFANQADATAACTYTMTVAKGGAQKAVAYKSGQDPDVLAAILQGMGWSEGEYVITTHASALSTLPNLPPCLGSSTHKLTVVSGGAITSTLRVSHDCKNTWDSNSIFYAADKIYCDVLLNYRILGAPCNYSISVQGPGEAPVTYRQTHMIEGSDLLGFEIFRGRNSKEVLDQVVGKPYKIHIWASPQDKVGGSGCGGDYQTSVVLLNAA